MQTILRENPRHETVNNTEDPAKRALRDYISRSIDRFATEDYQVYVDGDLSAWVEHMEAAPGITTVNSVYDPRCSTFGPDEAFWVGIEQEGEIVGTSCNRLFVSEDHVRDDIVTQRLWGDKEAPERPVHLLLPADVPTFSGRVVHEGGAWVHPRHWGRGLAERLVFLSRAVSMRTWDPVVFTGTCLESLFDKGVSRTHYKIPNDALLLDGWCPPMRENRRMYLTWIWAGEVLDEILPETRRERVSA